MPAQDEFERIIMKQTKYTPYGRSMQEKIIQEHRRQVKENHELMKRDAIRRAEKAKKYGSIPKRSLEGLGQ